MTSQVVSKAQQERLASLVDVLSPARSLDRLDTFGKWLFGGLATVGSLAVGLSVTVFSLPKGLGQVTFIATVAVLGFSLAIGAIALAPIAVRANPNSLASMQQAVAVVFVHRRRLYCLAAYGFAATLVLAGLTPLADQVEFSTPTSHVFTSYQLSGNGTLSVGATGQHLQPFTPLTITVKGLPASPSFGSLASNIQPISSTVIDDSGSGHVGLTTSAMQPGSITVSIAWTPASGGSRTTLISVPVTR